MDGVSLKAVEHGEALLVGVLPTTILEAGDSRQTTTIAEVGDNQPIMVDGDSRLIIQEDGDSQLIIQEDGVQEMLVLLMKEWGKCSEIILGALIG